MITLSLLRAFAFSSSSSFFPRIASASANLGVAWLLSGALVPSAAFGRSASVVCEGAVAGERSAIGLGFSERFAEFGFWAASLDRFEALARAATAPAEPGARALALAALTEFARGEWLPTVSDLAWRHFTQIGLVLETQAESAAREFERIALSAFRGKAGEKASGQERASFAHAALNAFVALERSDPASEGDGLARREPRYPWPRFHSALADAREALARAVYFDLEVPDDERQWAYDYLHRIGTQQGSFVPRERLLELESWRLGGGRPSWL